MLSARSYQDIIPPEPKTVGFCAACEGEIGSGDPCMRLGDDIIHEDCLAEFCEKELGARYGFWTRDGMWIGGATR